MLSINLNLFNPDKYEVILNVNTVYSNKLPGAVQFFLNFPKIVIDNTKRK
jgi:hypothetical protein